MMNTDPDLPEFKTALKVLLEETLRLSKAEDDQHPFKTLLGSGGLSSSYKLIGDPEFVIQLMRVMQFAPTSVWAKGIDEPEGTSALVKAFMGTYDLENVDDQSSLCNRLVAPLYKVGWDRENYTVDEKFFDDVIDLYSTCWFNNHWYYDVVVPIYNVSLDGDEYTVGDFKLETVSDDEKSKQGSILAGADCALKLKLRLFDCTPNDWNKITSEIEDVVTYLRLRVDPNGSATTDIGLNNIHLIPTLKRYEERNVKSHKTKLHVRVDQKGYGLLSGPKPTIDADTIEFCNLCLANKATHSQLGLSIRRFNLSHGREDLEDQIIDLVIAIESCMLRSTSKAEIKYKLGIRTAYFLRDRCDPAKTRSIIDVAYDVRSGIVHSGKDYQSFRKELKKLDEFEISSYSFPSALKEIVRLTLVDLVDFFIFIHRPERAKKKPQTLEQFSKLLDDMIVKAITIPSAPAE